MDQDSPLAGRQLLGPAHPDDAGEPDPRLRAALTGHAERREPGTGYAEVLAALCDARLLVPVVAVLGEAEVTEGGLARDKSSDMAVVLMQRGDGRRGLLAFSGLDSLQAWDPQARPVPVPARLAAQATVQEEADALVVDIAGPARAAVEGEHLGALAAGWRLSRVGGELGWIGPAPE